MFLCFAFLPAFIYPHFPTIFFLSQFFLLVNFVLFFWALLILPSFLPLSSSSSFYLSFLFMSHVNFCSFIPFSSISFLNLSNSFFFSTFFISVFSFFTSLAFILSHSVSFLPFFSLLSFSYISFLHRSNFLFPLFLSSFFYVFFFSLFAHPHLTHGLLFIFLPTC